MRSYRALRLIARVSGFIGKWVLVLCLAALALGIVGYLIDSIAVLLFRRSVFGTLSLIYFAAPLALPVAFVAFQLLLVGQITTLILNAADDLYAIRNVTESKALINLLEGIHKKLTLLEAYERARGSSKPTDPSS